MQVCRQSLDWKLDCLLVIEHYPIVITHVFFSFFVFNCIPGFYVYSLDQRHLCFLYESYSFIDSS